MTKIGIMEPLLPEEGKNPQLVDLAADLIGKTSSLSAQLHPTVAASIGEVVRSMNCYYSNLIEGHNTHPRDINRALANNFSQDSKKRALQLEAKAHIEVQRLIDIDDIDREQLEFSPSSDFIRWIHFEFYNRLPEELLWSKNSDTGKETKVIAGEFRQDWVQVGYHVAPAPEDIAALLQRFAEAYSPERLNKIQAIIAVAASHHRLLWIHPFLDGNGRVARLFSHAFLSHIGIGSSLWSISRGLARQAEEYKTRLATADNPRQGDLDGRGTLSAKGLELFCDFFLTTCIDQVNYMESLIEPPELMRRIELYIAEEEQAKRLPKGCLPILREVLFSGEMERGKAPAVTGYQERQARTILSALLQADLIISDTPKGPVRLNFPLDIIERWLPKLYPFGLA